MAHKADKPHSKYQPHDYERDPDRKTAWEPCAVCGLDKDSPIHLWGSGKKL